VTRARGQRGWIGLLGLLLALVIVALLAQKMLKTYGLLPSAEPGTKATVEVGPRVPGDASPAPPDPTVVTPTPTTALERARGLENAVQQQANEINKRMDETAK
jgi:hypothetical protein